MRNLLSSYVTNRYSIKCGHDSSTSNIKLRPSNSQFKSDPSKYVLKRQRPWKWLGPNQARSYIIPISFRCCRSRWVSMSCWLACKSVLHALVLTGLQWRPLLIQSPDGDCLPFWANSPPLPRPATQALLFCSSVCFTRFCSSILCCSAFLSSSHILRKSSWYRFRVCTS